MFVVKGSINNVSDTADFAFKKFLELDLRKSTFWTILAVSSVLHPFKILEICTAGRSHMNWIKMICTAGRSPPTTVW